MIYSTRTKNATQKTVQVDRNSVDGKGVEAVRALSAARSDWNKFFVFTGRNSYIVGCQPGKRGPSLRLESWVPSRDRSRLLPGYVFCTLIAWVEGSFLQRENPWCVGLSDAAYLGVQFPKPHPHLQDIGYRSWHKYVKSAGKSRSSATTFPTRTT